MDQKVEIDTFMICLEVADYYPDANVIFWLDYLHKKIHGKIHIILYRSIKPEVRKKYTGEKIIWISELAKTYDALEKYIGAQDKSDAVIIVGGERLANSSSDKAISLLEFDDRDSRLHLLEDEDWEAFSRQADRLFGGHQSDISGLILICNVNDSIVNVLNRELENSNNMSICRTEMSGYHHESADCAVKILREIGNKSLQDALDMIDDNAEKMSLEHITLCQAITYHSNGNITKTIELLNSIYDSLQDEHRLFLAEMYILQGSREKAQRIFEEVYRRDKKQKGLFELGLRTYIKGEERYDEILTEGIRYEPDNPVLMEKYANLLVSQGKHKEAAAGFRKINTPYHELIARVNDLLADGQSDIKIVKSYLFEVVEENPELKNIALLKVAAYAETNGHYYNAYHLLREAELSEMSDATQDILKMKMKILGDTEKAGRALGKLKPYIKDRDLNMLLQERCQVLFECVNYFSHFENGFGYWRGFMECQQMDTWNISLKPYLMRCVRELTGIDYTALLEKSYIAKLHISEDGLDCDTAIYLLRISNSEEIPSEEMGCTREEAVQASSNLIEMNGTDVQRIWLRYYCSIGESLFHENPQIANNYSLSILEYGKTAEKEKGDLIAALFLMSWANAQYRLGNCVEGIICAIIAIKQLVQIGEVVPVLEEGLNIIAKYLGTYDQKFNAGEKAEITIFIHKLKIYNKSLEPLLFRYTDNTEEVLLEYEEKVKTDEKDITWLIDLNNLIVGKAGEKKYDDAVGYIKEYYLVAQKLLEQRKDIAPQLLYSWGNILTRAGHGIENIMLGLDLYDMALVFVQRRRKVHHQEERAALAEIHDKIVRAFLCFAGLLYQLKDIAQEVKAELEKRICEKMAVCLPLSVIEEKKYYSEKTISDELENKYQELQHLKQEYAVMLKNNSVENADVSKMAERIEGLTKELVRSHPYYMSLPQFRGTDWKKLQNILKPDEVVYQYVLTDICMISMLVTGQWIDVRCKSFTEESDTIPGGMKKYGNIVEISEAGDDRLDRASAVISQAVADHLCEYVFHYDIKSVYVMPDISKSIFPFTAVQYKGDYLIDKVENIINFLDYEQLICLVHDERKSTGIINKVFGKKEDFSIKYIKDWLDAYSVKGVVNITDCLDDFDRLAEECRKGADTVVIYGHGAKDPASENVEGAQVIQGAGSMISVRKLLNSVHAENLILISCVGGTPNSLNPEMSSGTWTGIFERFSGNIMVCRWKVPTKDTMEMMGKIFQNLLEKQMGFAKALLMAQRSMKDGGKTQLSWAGVECWIN